MTFNVEAVGIGKGEALPPPTLQPSPLFPVKYKPVPLQTGEEVEYMLALKQELRGAMKNLPYFINWHLLWRQNIVIMANSHWYPTPP
uniref:Uncharacterized protein n=1 Tax=Podarcis muralis TaxID=64176 RepID=A0A670JUH0_PODMU